jgi:hypothetical protein
VVAHLDEPGLELRVDDDVVAVALEAVPVVNHHVLPTTGKLVTHTRDIGTRRLLVLEGAVGSSNLARAHRHLPMCPTAARSRGRVELIRSSRQPQIRGSNKGQRPPRRCGGSGVSGEAHLHGPDGVDDDLVDLLEQPARRLPHQPRPSHALNIIITIIMIIIIIMMIIIMMIIIMMIIIIITTVTRVHMMIIIIITTVTRVHSPRARGWPR